MPDVAYRGYWWLPDNEEATHPGTLMVADDGSARLELVGGFTPRSWVPIPENPNARSMQHISEWDIVHGRAGGENFTLFGCSLVSARGGFFDDTTHELTLNVLRGFKGPKLLNSRDEPAFNGAAFELDYLLPWSGLGSMSATINMKRRTSSAATRRPTSLKASYGSMDFELYVNSSFFDFEWADSNTRLTAARERAFISISTKRARPIAQFDARVKAIQDLVTIAMDRPCGVRSQVYAAAVPQRTLPNGRVLPQPKYNFESFGQQIYRGTGEPLGRGDRDALFTLRDISFGRLLPSWLNLYAKAQGPIQILTGQKYVQAGYLGTRLLTVCTAVEALHRDLYDRPRMTPEAHRALVDAATAGVPPDQRQLVANGIINSLSYKERALDLADKLGAKLTEKLVGDVDSWSRALRTARVGQAHATRTGRPLGPDIEFRLMQVTQAILSLTLAKKLRIKEARLLEFLTSSPVVSHAAAEYQRLS